ncbi:MAG: PhzF family phenazine biosynthesis protein [Miltoncostaeaceae bacterium]
MSAATPPTDRAAAGAPRELPLDVVDAFAEDPFTGNPAAVCLLAEAADEGWMQRLAAEMNLSETAFVTPPVDGAHGLRWFTPEAEVDLCGHATMAAAHSLWEKGRVARDAEIRFSTRSGDLVAGLRPDGIALDFPATPPRPAEPIAGLPDALGSQPVELHRTVFDILALFASPAEVVALSPDFRSLGAVAGIRGVVCTAGGDIDGGGADFVSRFFAPAVGVNEDPVTGSAHCALGPFWAPRLGSTRLTGHQVSTRGGTVIVTVRGDRVTLEGRALTVVRGSVAGPDEAA